MPVSQCLCPIVPVRGTRVFKVAHADHVVRRVHQVFAMAVGRLQLFDAPLWIATTSSDVLPTSPHPWITLGLGALTWSASLMRVSNEVLAALAYRPTLSSPPESAIPLERTVVGRIILPIWAPVSTLTELNDEAEVLHLYI